MNNDMETGACGATKVTYCRSLDATVDVLHPTNLCKLMLSRKLRPTTRFETSFVRMWGFSYL